MQILFYDVTTPRVYTDLTLTQTGLGGTESTIMPVSAVTQCWLSLFSRDVI